MSIFRSAILGTDGEVDAGYLAMFWGVAVWIAAETVILLAGATVLYRLPPEHSDQIANILQSTGVAFGAAATGFATMLGAVGLFRMGDKQHAPPPVTT